MKHSEYAPVLNFSKVHKRYGRFVAPKGILAQGNRGEVACFVGPAGSGRSPMLRCCNVLETLDEGEIFLDGVSLTALGVDVSLLQRMAWRSRVSICFRT